MSDCRQIDSYPPDGRSGPLFPSKCVILQNQTGIGVFILSSRRHTLSSGYFFQVAITPCILEPLEAEDWALLLGARLAAALNLQVLNFLHNY